LKLSAIIAPLLAAKADPATILALVEAYEAEVEEGKEKARVRWRKWKEGHSTNVGKRLQTRTNVNKQLAGAVEDKPLLTEIEPLDKKTSRTADVAAFKAGLAPDVPEEILTDFVKVRRTKRGALTGYAAKLFREDAAACSMSVADAAKECVRSSWITVKPEYFTSRQRAGPSPRAPSQAEVFAIIARNPTNAIEPGPSEDRGSFRQAIPHLSAVRTG
jgi:hypothetical protein